MIAIKVLFAFALLAYSCDSLRLGRAEVLKPFYDGKAFKVISGLHNFDAQLVSDVSWAAYHGGATHVDIACDAQLVQQSKRVSRLPVCVSSVKPNDFVAAVAAGADMIEIGNFDGFYEQGIEFSAADVLLMTQQTRALLPDIPLSVTVPHTLSLPEQVKLAKQLQESGADVLQTEGKLVSAPAPGMGVQQLIELAAPTLAAAHALSAAVSIPVMCASGLTDVTAPFALAAGARGVGVGSIVNRCSSRQHMLLAVMAVAQALGLKPSSSDSSNAELMLQEGADSASIESSASSQLQQQRTA